MSHAYSLALVLAVEVAGDDQADGQAEPAVDLAHPLGVAGRQVVVDRDEVHAPAGEAVEVGRQGRDERLALAGLHLGDPAEVQGGAAHELHVVVALADGALGGLARDRERLDQEVVEVLAVVEPLAELGGLGPRARRRTASPVSGSKALMSGTRLASARTFLPSPARRMRSRTPMGYPMLPAGVFAAVAQRRDAASGRD